jgi:hypothetical protein
MTNIDSNVLSSITGGMGNHPNTKRPTTETTTTTEQPTTPTTTPAPQSGSTFWGNVCRAGYTSLGAAVGASLAGWGSVPGAVVGAVVGNTVCPP